MIPYGLSGKLLFGNAVLLVVTLTLCFWIIFADAQARDNRRAAQSLLVQAVALRPAFEDALGRGQVPDLSPLIPALTENDTRIAVLAPGGEVLAESGFSAAGLAAGARLADARIEVALRGGVVQSRAPGRSIAPPVERQCHTVIERLGPAEAPLGVLWIEHPDWSLVADPASFVEPILGLVLIVALSTVLVGIGLGRLWSRPLRRITEAARSLSDGDLSARIDVSGADELGLLARSLNAMRNRIGSHLETIDEQRRTFESLLNQLQEGVVVADSAGRVVLLNPAAAQLLGLRFDPASIQRCIGVAVERSIPLHDLQLLLRPLSPSASNGTPGAAERQLPDEIRLQVDNDAGTVHLLARATDIFLPAGAGSVATADHGRVVVLTDITKLVRMVQIKSDFAANASHELRTPLSTIRAAVDALLTMNLVHDAAQADRFIQVIDRHSARLGDMVSDLLDLNRVENPTAPFQVQPLDWSDVMRAVSERFEERVEKKALRWRTAVVGAPDDAHVVANPYLLRLVLDNLADNAIKFTPEGGEVGLTLRVFEDAVAIEVADTGCGIPAEDQQRVFERFYQVERARSGPERGTGLGLSIVRHAVNAMGGAIKLTSEVGVGTRFTVTIPQRTVASAGHLD
ncbi:MAG: PAS domain-containing sensor histidine kinase [Phycisphaerae bacterium]